MNNYNQSQLQDAIQNVLSSCVMALFQSLPTVVNFLNQLPIEFNRHKNVPGVDHCVILCGFISMGNSIKLSQKTQRMRLVICN